MIGVRNALIVRHWELFRALVVAKNGLSIADCVEVPSEPVSSRTIRRDLDALECVFPMHVEYTDNGARYRIDASELKWLPKEAAA